MIFVFFAFFGPFFGAALLHDRFAVTPGGLRAALGAWAVGAALRSVFRLPARGGGTDRGLKRTPKMPKTQKSLCFLSFFGFLAFKRTPGSFKRTPGSFKRTPGSFKRTPGSFCGGVQGIAA